MVEPIISVNDLSIGFSGHNGVTLPILRNIDLAVASGETVGLVGESGSGKSTLALAMMGYLKSGLRVLQGETRFRGHDTFGLSARELETIRGGDLALIPQNAGQSLTPTLRIGAQIEEALRLHSSVALGDQKNRVIELLEKVRLPDPAGLVARFPHELSGGQQQRVAIAMALAGEPNALLLDEPTTGLDVTTQAHVLELLRDLTREAGTAMVYVSHDLGAIARVCDRVAVMYAGEIVLEGESRKVLRAPVHPYARGLIASIPRLSSPNLPLAMEGRPPQPGGAGEGCAFATRCPLAEERCRFERPQPSRTSSDQLVRCHLHERVAIDAAAGAMRAARSRNIEGVECEAPILALDGLSISYARQGVLDQLLGRTPRAVPTVDDVSLVIQKGETIGIVGESGSGKSTILKAIAGLIQPRAGTIMFGNSTSLEGSVTRRTSDTLRQIQLIFQNPDESLNPRHTIGEILAQPLRLYFGLDGVALRQRSIALLERVRLGSHYLERLPSQLSGGEKQRVAIARAFAAEPKIILCDEVTSALDVSVQAAVLDLLDELRAEESVTYLFVSHDLAVVRALADRVVVLYQGRICEVGSAASVYAWPAHPYTEVLLGAVLEPDPDQVLHLLGEDVVELSPPERGCPFQRRCHRRIGEICSTTEPPSQDAGDGHIIRCHIDITELAEQQLLERPIIQSSEPRPHVGKQQTES
jgi:peptide/nickel transport system ATP-binding protein